MTTPARGRNFIDKCNEACLEQLVDFPTHVKGNLLDLVLCNNPEKIVQISSVGRLGKSDHESLVIEITGPMKKEERGTRKPMWGRADWDQMKRDWQAMDWRKELADLDTECSWQLIKKGLQDLVNKHVPTREWRPNTRPPWMSTELLRLIRQKRKLWAQHKKQQTLDSRARYKDKEREVAKKIKNAKRTMERKIASDTGNPKKFYSYIGSRTKTRTGVGPLKVNGAAINTDEEMAQELNNYFSEVFQEPDNFSEGVTFKKVCG